MMDEEFQIQLALELSAKEDPEAVQIEAVKQISLGSCDPENTAAEIVAYRYWNYNSLSYDDKILDGFYDTYGLILDSASTKMPSLVDLQDTSESTDRSCEVVTVNKKEDADLLSLEQKVSLMASGTRAESSDSTGSILVQKIAVIVANYMGGKVINPESMFEAYQTLTNSLRVNAGSIFLPLGRITVGLARHRALLFKVLADAMGIPCLLLKGKQYTGSDDGALNIVKLNDGREYIVDLMAEPGTLIPADSEGLATESEEAAFLSNPFSKYVKSTHMVLLRDELSSSASCPESEPSYRSSMSSHLRSSDQSGGIASKSSKKWSNSLSSPEQSPIDNSLDERMGRNKDSNSTKNSVESKVQQLSGRSGYSPAIVRAPSWTEGINSPAVHKMKVKDVSEYVINAAKENPKLAQKLQDVLLESGVVAPPNLFTEICTVEPEDSASEAANLMENRGNKKYIKNEIKQKTEIEEGCGPFLPRLPIQNGQRKVASSKLSMEPLKPGEGLKLRWFSDSRESNSSASASEAPDSHLANSQLQLIKQMPVAAAAATAAVVASSMVVAAAKTNNDLNLEVPVAAAAVTATAAAVAATTAAISRQYEYSETGYDDASSSEKNDVLVSMQQNSYGHNSLLTNQQTTTETQLEPERISDRSTGTESIKSESALEDVAEYEIAWEDIILGERIGLGSFGEVYRGDWHGTEVAVKRFLHQDISSDALDEFIREVQIMKRLRHPNVVLFMGAIIRMPNLSIVSEFLHRGSLFRLIHRPNNQLDEKRRLRMALDVARGMNYLHTGSPVIVHRDLKSPNLLVDKNWVVKVCDFGLSRIKHNTFLSSRSTAGTAEWMAPEVLRNEPSDEKCDVFSFGVILWELCTMQQPWEGMNPMQVVGAVGFQNRRLDIPDDMDPLIADIIRKCWQTDPRMRPSFKEIMAALKPMQKPASISQGMKQRAA